ncbi:hypothetical protein B9Z65_4649 [Elsinoe australis]|uniref:Protein PBN1 n=1 Tax=Elsinoe australis TaxID=40998 RepID=A0A2P8A5M8_9PEZI|nr:hypothetical protein B9Z65_4649 [Elsinoe australis]
MKERITFLVVDGEEGVNPAEVQVADDSIELPGIVAAKEWRVTLGLDQLPTQIQEVLKDSHELHVRWATSQYHETVSPLLARVSPGLHAFYTPLKGKPISPALCPTLKSIFGPHLKCDHAENAFSKTQVLSERFASSAAYQYYQQLPDIERLQFFFVEHICKEADEDCTKIAYELAEATLLEFDYDAISHAVVVTATWPPADENGIETKRNPEDRVEVGILNQETSKEHEEISLGGFLTVLGEDDEPKPTLFSFPSRHHQVSLSSAGSFTFNASFREPTGLHPTLQLTFDKSNLQPPLPSCSLHTYLTLPSTLFIDRYQFSDALFLASQNLVSLRSLSGETDLEAPEWVVKQWGSTALFEVAVPDDLPAAKRPRSLSDPWTVNIPMHLRYLPPRKINESSVYPPYMATGVETEALPGKRSTSIPYPAVFWACPADSGLKMSVNPFDRVNLGYDGLFGPKTMFWHVLPSMGKTLSVSLEVPVMNMERATTVESATAVVFSLLIINKAGGLIYTRTVSPGLSKLSSNDYLILAGTFHGIHAIARSLCPVPPSTLPPPSAAPSIFSPTTTASTPQLGTSTSVPGPQRQPSATGIQSLESGRFRLTVLQTPTGVKFLLFTSPEQQGTEGLLQRCYETYAQFVMGNPFYSLEMPIRVEKFEREVGRVLGRGG